MMGLRRVSPASGSRWIHHEGCSSPVRESWIYYRVNMKYIRITNRLWLDISTAIFTARVLLGFYLQELLYLWILTKLFKRVLAQIKVEEYFCLFDLIFYFKLIFEAMIFFLRDFFSICKEYLKDESLLIRRYDSVRITCFLNLTWDTIWTLFPT